MPDHMQNLRSQIGRHLQASIAIKLFKRGLRVNLALSALHSFPLRVACCGYDQACYRFVEEPLSRQHENAFSLPGG